MNLDRWSGAAFSYPEVGATAGELPPGYWHLTRSRQIGTGRDSFGRASAAVLGWQMQRSLGLGVRTSAPNPAPGVVVVLGRRPLQIPCRVVYTIDEPDRRGFAYGTLTGHPETGEECFSVRYDEADRSGGAVIAEVRAFARAATLPARLAGPLVRVGAGLIARRYLAAVAGC